MTNTTQTSLMPHHRLRAYGVAVQLLGAVRGARIRDRTLRDQALRAAKSVCLNCAEGAGRVTRADKARAYTVARGELVEAVAAVEIAASGSWSRRISAGAERSASTRARAATGWRPSR